MMKNDYLKGKRVMVRARPGCPVEAVSYNTDFRAGFDHLFGKWEVWPCETRAGLRADKRLVEPVIGYVTEEIARRLTEPRPLDGAIEWVEVWVGAGDWGFIPVLVPLRELFLVPRE